MSQIDQIQARRRQLGKPVQEIAATIAMAPSNLYRALSSRRDMRASSLNAMAAALDAEWVLVPKHLLPEVERLLAGKQIGPDDVPSSIDRLFGTSQ
jgi:transcriptional regulator with XRE-family HTH domain